jgi:hypothetical protein
VDPHPGPHPDQDPHYFGNLDPHQNDKLYPYPDPHPHQIKIKIQMCIKEISWIRNWIRNRIRIRIICR